MELSIVDRMDYRTKKGFSSLLHFEVTDSNIETSYSLSQIINTDFKPDHISLNGVDKSSSSRSFNFNKGENEIILKWNNQLEKCCEKMFYGCNKMKEIDLSEFNTSEATSMSKMFGGCTSLTKIILTNLKTSQVKTMDYNVNSLFFLINI